MADDSYLDELEARSIFIIREAYFEFKEGLAALWSMGKDSTVLIHILRKAFFAKAAIPVIHLDTSFKFKQIYDFRNRLSGEWGLNLIVSSNKKALKRGMCPDKGRFNCCTALKTQALKEAIKKHNLKALLLAIRRDEHAIRAKERYFSERTKEFKWDYQNQTLELWGQYYSKKADSNHIRIHPMLHWQEIDVWRYIRREKLPFIGLYLANSGKRYRSIGCECCCSPVVSSADNLDKIIEEIKSAKECERSGRCQDKEREYMMQKLRSLGYM